MTQPVKVTDQTQESVGQTTSSSGLRRLHPADGLFLRAEHLQQIQDYARELFRTGALAAGTGVAYGFELSVNDSQLQVKPGLAFDPSGQPLRTQVAVTLDLGKLTVRPGRFWVVGVTSAPPQAAGQRTGVRGAVRGPLRGRQLDPALAGRRGPGASHPERHPARGGHR